MLFDSKYFNVTVWEDIRDVDERTNTFSFINRVQKDHNVFQY
jgi:hypothetical protein